MSMALYKLKILNHLENARPLLTWGIKCLRAPQVETGGTKWIYN